MKKYLIFPQVIGFVILNLNKSNTTMIFINQIREKIGGFGFGPQTTTTGGRALKFYSSVRMVSPRNYPTAPQFLS